MHAIHDKNPRVFQMLHIIPILILRQHYSAVSECSFLYEYINNCDVTYRSMLPNKHVANVAS